jgi:hypothetical protein
VYYDLYKIVYYGTHTGNMTPFVNEPNLFLYGSNRIATTTVLSAPTADCNNQRPVKFKAACPDTGVTFLEGALAGLKSTLFICFTRSASILIIARS